MRNHWQIQTTQKVFDSLLPTKRQNAIELAEKQFYKPVNKRLSPEEILVRVLASNYWVREEML